MLLSTIGWAIVLIVSSIIMAKSAEILITSLTNISRFFNLSEFAISFILMAAATSLPELFVGINSALVGESVLALGNVIGSNIVNLTLVVGITVLMVKNIRVRSTIAKRDSMYMFFLGGFPLVLLLDGSLGRFEGLALIFFYILYISRLLQQKKEFQPTTQKASGKQAFYSLLYFLGAILLLLGSSKILITAAEGMAINLKLPLTLIGLVIVSIGTSLPEIIFETKAIRKFKSELVLGDLIGSVVTNTTLVLGVTAVISPIYLEVPSIFYSSAIFLLAALLLFNIFIRSERKLETFEGMILIFVYIFFLIVEMGVGLAGH